jgi:hypothetical protein
VTSDERARIANALREIADVFDGASDEAPRVRPANDVPARRRRSPQRPVALPAVVPSAVAQEKASQLAQRMGLIPRKAKR